MTGTNAQQQRLMRERARALATLALTRRSDVSVADETADVGVDLIVRIHAQNKPGLRQFGVELRYVWGAVTAARANTTLTAVLRGHKTYAPFPFPVALFFFTMENDQGWYTWVAEPTISRAGVAGLPVREAAACHPLNDAAVDAIIADVDRWYDAFYRNVSPASAPS